jgi:hypothetical protein
MAAILLHPVPWGGGAICPDVRTRSAVGIGFVFQQFRLEPGVPAPENVADRLLYADERRERVEAALQRVGLGCRLTRRLCANVILACARIGRSACSNAGCHAHTEGRKV